MGLELLLILAFLNIEPWVQFGLAGVCFFTLATLFFRSQRTQLKMLEKLSNKKDVDVNWEVLIKTREETLREITIRDTRFMELQEKTIKAINKSGNAMEKVADKLEELLDNER